MTDIAYQESIEVEASLLAGVINLRTDLDTPAHLSALEPESFIARAHQCIWQAWQAIVQGGGMIDAWATGKAMRKIGALDADTQAMETLFADAPNVFYTADLRPMVEKVAESYKRRMLARSLASLADRAMSMDLPALDVEFSEVAGKVAQAGNPRLRTSTDYAKQFESFLNGRPILPLESRNNLSKTGIFGIDDVIVANPGRLIVIGGLPSCGKTALAVQIAVKTAGKGSRVAMGSLEMDEDEISSRIVACACGVNSLVAMRSGSDIVGPEDRKTLTDIRRNLIGVHGCAGDSWSSLEAAIVREHRHAPLSVAIIDYLQLLGEPDTKSRRNDTEAHMIGEITKAAKRLAQRLKINVLMLSQFNRKVEEGQEPTLQHFLGSGQIERDIDIALLLWNAEVNPDTAKTERTVYCRIAKNRGGVRYGKVTLAFNPAFNQFKEAESKKTTGYTEPNDNSFHY